MTMKRFVHDENIKHLRQLLARTADDAECMRIVRLIEEQEANKAGGDPSRENP
jgi:hypothetical protein